MLVFNKFLISFYVHSGLIIEKRIKNEDEWVTIINLKWYKYYIYYIKIKYKILFKIKKR